MMKLPVWDRFGISRHGDVAMVTVEDADTDASTHIHSTFQHRVSVPVSSTRWRFATCESRTQGGVTL